MQYANLDKLRRAQKWVKDSGNASEDAVRERYLALGGLLISKEEEVADDQEDKPKKPRKPRTEA